MSHADCECKVTSRSPKDINTGLNQDPNGINGAQEITASPPTWLW